MEHTISKLIGSYEKGNLSRRQLIAGLVALATSAYSAPRCEGFSLPSAEMDAPDPYSVVAVGINHVGINVSDVARSVRWYRSVFGLQDLVQSKEVAVMGFRDRAPGSTSFVFRTTKNPRLSHIMFGIDNYDPVALKRYLQRRGLTCRDDRLSYHVQDPDGIDVQVGDKNLHPSETVLKPQ